MSLAKLQIAFLVVFSVTTPLSASEVSTAAILECRTIENDIARLECYDGIEIAGQDVESQNQPNKADSNTMDSLAGNWIIERKKNPIDNSRGLVAMLAATEGTGLLDEPVQLYLRCERKVPEVFIYWRQPLGGSARVLARLDKNAPSNKRWTVSRDLQGTFYPGSHKQFMERIAESSRLAVEVIPKFGNKNIAVFDLEGSDQVVDEIRKFCPW